MIHIRQIHRRERTFRERADILQNFDDTAVVERYRIDKGGIRVLLDLVEDDIEPRTTRSHAISAETKVPPIGRYKQM